MGTIEGSRIGRLQKAVAAATLLVLLLFGVFAIGGPHLESGTARAQITDVVVDSASLAKIVAVPAVERVPESGTAAAAVLGAGSVRIVPAWAGGWDRNHAWLTASYRDVIILGSTQIAGLICARIGGVVAKHVCQTAVEPVVKEFTRGKPAISNHGIWIEAYPTWNLRVTVRAGTW